MNENDEYAFPYAAEWGRQNGMTLRDYFAGQALAATEFSNLKNHVTVKDLATSCYNIADAMLAARKS